MKNTFLILFCICSNVYGQTVYTIDTCGELSICDTCSANITWNSHDIITHEYQLYIRENDSDFARIEIIDCDTVIEIGGDTTKAIKSLFKALNDSMQENKRLGNLLNEAGELLYQKYYGIELILPEKKRI